jgi:FkbM family methyltransferase
MIREALSVLPERAQLFLKQIRYHRQIRQGAFGSPEPEFRILADIVGPGDWCVDVGANIGHYTLRLSKLVGGDGRVFAFEPIPEAFFLLANNALSVPENNITLFNCAASCGNSLAVMSIPRFESGMRNYYESSIVPPDSAGGGSGVETKTICCTSMDNMIPAERKISLIKIDAEGHESNVVDGGLATIRRHNPIIIAEGTDGRVQEMLSEIGYGSVRFNNSPNTVYCHAVDSRSATIKRLAERPDTP